MIGMRGSGVTEVSRLFKPCADTLLVIFSRVHSHGFSKPVRPLPASISRLCHGFVSRGKGAHFPSPPPLPIPQPCLLRIIPRVFNTPLQIRIIPDQMIIVFRPPKWSFATENFICCARTVSFPRMQNLGNVVISERLKNNMHMVGHDHPRVQPITY